MYRTHFAAVARAVGRYCRGADADAVIHEVFLALIEGEQIRRGFRGGNLAAWLTTVAARRAIDHLRRHRRRQEIAIDATTSLEGGLEPLSLEEGLVHRDQLRVLRGALEDFAKEVLPGLKSHLAEVFEARFVRHHSQTEAARRLGVARGTLVDREKSLLRRLGPFLRKRLEGGPR